MSTLKPLNLAEDLGSIRVPPHAGLHPGPTRRVLLLIGGHTGRVGSALLKLLSVERRRLLLEHRIEFHVTGTVNRREADWHDPDSPWRTDTVTRHGDDWPGIIARFRGYMGPKLFVDCSASAEIAGHYGEFFQSGIGIVTPNKLSLSGSQHAYQELQAAREVLRLPYRYETTVGAALPLLGALADLKDNGDRVERVEAVLSGTLSFLFQRLNQGRAFSVALREARDAGLTEPHPAEDLKGQDSARKLLILLREAGLEWEPERVTVQDLLPPELAAEADAERFLTQLAAHDPDWALQRRDALRQGLQLVYLAEFDGQEARVGLRRLPATDPFAQLAAGENLVRVWTERYQPVPLSIAGPGAGTEVTAAGLLTDLIKAVTGAKRM